MSHHYRDSYRPGRVDDGPPRPPRGVADNMYRFGSNQKYRREFHFKPKIYERDLLTMPTSTKEVPVLGSSQNTQKYRDIEGLTDSEEEVMDEGESDNDDIDRAKRRKLLDASAQPVTHKWSNPDPYTALPPATETNGKRIDVVRLIRKSRNDNETQANTMADQDDFISFGDFDGDDAVVPPPSAPKGPRSTRDGLHAEDSASNPRKRKRDASDRDVLLGPPGRSYHTKGTVLSEWRATEDFLSTPWLEDVNPTDSPMVALHKEVIDFYEWVRPQDFENIVREDLIARLTRELKRYKAGCRIESFGSYAAGLYLPIGDMDLVCFLPNLQNDAMPITRNEMNRIAGFLERSRMARPGSIVTIPKAKVPIIKFVDNATGLKVDLSFNNTTGTKAIATFKQWQDAYPAMPILVAIVKQFLMIRGLNDNSVGGLGGFAIICMVTSLVQNLPTSRYQNLGELLVEFFNLYGVLFDIRSVGIRLDPPGYIDKYNYMPLVGEKADRLMIIDPNRPDNNITGGSSLVGHILPLFAKAHSTLERRLDDFSKSRSNVTKFSFLEDFLGGNFSAYYDQRRALHAVFATLQNTRDNVPPPPSSMPPIVPPPPADTKTDKAMSGTPKSKNDTDSSAGDTNSTPAFTTARKRLERFRRLYPEWRSKLEKLQALTKPEALKLGSWKSVQDMNRALNDKERKLRKH